MSRRAGWLVRERVEIKVVGEGKWQKRGGREGGEARRTHAQVLGCLFRLVPDAAVWPLDSAVESETLLVWTQSSRNNRVLHPNRLIWVLLSLGFGSPIRRCRELRNARRGSRALLRADSGAVNCKQDDQGSVCPQIEQTAVAKQVPIPPCCTCCIESQPRRLLRLLAQRARLRQACHVSSDSTKSTNVSSTTLQRDFRLIIIIVLVLEPDLRKRPAFAAVRTRTPDACD